MARRPLQHNGLLFNRTNSKELVGKTAIYKSEIPAIYAGYLVRITPVLADSDYLNYVMQSQYYWSYCQSVRSDAIGQSNINAEKLKRFVFPIPPLAEQKRIVARLEELLPLCERLKWGEFMEKRIKCPICDTETICYPDYDRDLVFFSCPVCGRFQLDAFEKLNYNHLASYLLYNGFRHGLFEYRYHTVLDKETCDKYRKDFDNGNNVYGRPVHMDANIIENWYPKTFSERVDRILLFLNSRIKHIGQQITLSYQELLSALFVDRKELDESSLNGADKWSDRNPDDCEYELKYMLDYLRNRSYIEYTDGPSEEEWIDISLTPEGYARVDVLQKNTSYGRQVLVAMKFGDDTKPLREAIRKGIKDAEYNAIFIDEVQHNDFITPELLKHIRDSKFIVVDLTHQNNGAYLEEGYAMGLGKPVIQLCKKDTILHFDIAQKNTIIWETEDEIPERLTNRIKATID